MKEIVYKRAETNEELIQILALQTDNLAHRISEEDIKKEGFVTVHHDFELLKAMNDSCAHCIAKKADKVVGYALSMTRDFKEKIDVLKPMFEQIDNNLKPNINYMVMGQICIDKAFRKQGIFKGLYQFMCQQLQHDFDAIITEVDATNTRSLDAHYAVGFKCLMTYRADNQNWKLISWDMTPE